MDEVNEKMYRLESEIEVKQEKDENIVEMCEEIKEVEMNKFGFTEQNAENVKRLVKTEEAEQKSCGGNIETYENKNMDEVNENMHRLESEIKVKQEKDENIVEMYEEIEIKEEVEVNELKDFFEQNAENVKRSVITGEAEQKLSGANTGPSYRFDTDLLIDEVEKRPAIWDMSSSFYKDRGAKKRSWEEIVEVFCSSAESEDKKNASVILQKKWKNLRDSFVKEFKKLKTLPSGSGSKAGVTYIYFKRLQFLASSISNKETISNLEKDTIGADTSYDEDVTVKRVENGSSVGRKKLKLNAGDKHFADILEKSLLLRKKEEELQNDEDRLFCLSLYKEMKKVPENKRLMTKIELMNVIQRAQQVACPPFYSQQYTAHSGYTSQTQPVHHTLLHNEPHASTSRYNSQTPTLVHPPAPSPGAASSVSENSEDIDLF